MIRSEALRWSVSDCVTMHEYLNADDRFAFLDLGDRAPTARLARPSLILITHLLPDRPAFLNALSIFFEIDAVVAIPYSTNREVCDHLNTQFRIIEPTLDQLLNSDWVTETIRALARRDYFVLEIGGYLSAAQSSLAGERAKPRLLGIVEGTESGLHRYAGEKALAVPVIAMPRSPLKTIESLLVGPSCFFSFERLLREVGLTHEPKTIFVNGFGRIGTSVALDARRRGLEVIAFDTVMERRLSALALGFAIPSREACLTRADVIFGCTGVDAWEIADLKHMPGRKFLVSATSKDVEFRFSELRMKLKTEQLTDGLHLLTHDWGEVLIVNEGRPVNFRDGAELGDVLVLFQAEMIATLQHLAVSIPEPGLHLPPAEVRERIMSDWIEVKISPQTGWPTPSKLRSGRRK